MKLPVRGRAATLAAVFAAFLSGCGAFSRTPETPLEMVAFGSLRSEEQALLPASPKDSLVRKVIVDDQLAKRVGEAYKGREIYEVTFRHTASRSSGNLTVYIDMDRTTVIGRSVPIPPDTH